MRKLFDFHGGIHPPAHKTESTVRPIVRAPLPKRLVLPLKQHAGDSAIPTVQVGDAVLKGQIIASPASTMSAAVHAPTSGRVIAIDRQLVPSADGHHDLCISIDVDGEDRSVAFAPFPMAHKTRAEVLGYLRAMGVVGLGGAVFPSAAKIAADHGMPIHTLIINGSECEPYISCDSMLMRERADDVARGVALLQQLCDARDAIIAIEDNKPEAIATMQGAAKRHGGGIEIVSLPTVYPSGGAKQLIKLLTDIEVPGGRHAPEYGVQCFNSGTAYSIFRAIDLGEPVMTRIITVAGNVRTPQNYEACLGTSLGELLALAVEESDTDGHIVGGPLMGYRIGRTDLPLVKAANCVIATSKRLFPPAQPALPCIRCGQCVEACPAELLPHDMYWFAKAKNFDRAADYSVRDCIECGACNYVCPSRIPLVQYFKQAKSELNKQAKAEAFADASRERFEHREQRLARLESERAAPVGSQLNGSTPTLASNAIQDDQALKDAAVHAALVRARARRERHALDDTPP
ncbi:MAG: electron transport complex subunit RsxC [Pseudomonadota bacterium]|nr:electron transport complex subunit RsxC [Pseudomonadota bacterium]